MKSKPTSAADDPSEEIALLVRRLDETQKRLLELTGGEVDAVVSSGGQSYLLKEAQEKLRTTEETQRQLAATLMVILNALPAHIALLDAKGRIISVNDAWLRFASANLLQGPKFFAGQDYIKICEEATGQGADEAHAAAVGIRKVIEGNASDFTIEYPCHSPTEKRWFQLIVSPVRDDKLKGAVVMHINITERKRTETRFSRLVNSNAQGVVFWGAKGEIIEANQAYLDMIGYNREDLRAGRINWIALTPPEHAHLDQLAHEELAATGISTPYEKEYIRKDGSRVPVFIGGAMLENNANEGVSFVIDNTKRKLAEEALRESEEKFRSMFTAAAIGIAITTPQGSYLHANAAYCRMLGCTEEEILARDFVSLTHPDDLALNLKLKDEMLNRRRKSYVMEKRYLKKDGTIVWSNASVSATYSIRGEVETFIIVAEDITKRKGAEDSLHLQTERLDLATRSAGIGIWDWNIQKDELVWDDRMYALYGKKAGDFSGAYQSWLNGLHPDDRERTNEILMRAVRGEGEYDTEFRVVWPNGSVRTLKANGHVLRDHEGQSLRMIGINYDITKRLEAEHELQKSERELQELATKLEAERSRLVDAQAVAKVGSWETDLATLEVTWSAETYRIFETSPDQFSPTHPGFLRFVHPDDQAAVDGAFKKSIDQRSTCDIAHRIVMPDGRIKVVEERWKVFRDKQEKPVRALGTCHDITKRKQAEEAQRLSEERFSHAFEYAPNGMVLVGPDNKLITANRILCDLIGYSLSELVGKTFQEVTHPDDIETEMELIDETLAGSIHFYELEKRYIHKNGNQVWVHLNASLVRDFQGQPLYFIKQLQDITEIKRAYEQISQQAALIDEATDAIIVRDLDHRIIFWSKGAERLYGWTADEANGQRLQDLLNPEPVKFKEAERSLSEKGAWNGEIEKHTKSGSALSINGRWTLLRDDRGQPRSILTIDTDISERKKLELQFLRAQRMESIGTLAGGIAHDLNNILAPILMSIDILKMTTKDPQATEILKTIEVSSKRGADIVRQVLSFARGMEGERAEVQPKHLLKDIDAIIRDTFPKNIRQELSLVDDPWTIFGDPTLVHQILLNLCVNARDAMPNGGKLTIAVENCVLDKQYAAMNTQAKPGRYVLISVTDTGTGIPRDIVDKIFEPFFTTKEVGKGTGLGLSTVLGIVKSHDGIVNVYSEPGKGTSFKVYLPAMESSSDEKKVQTQSVSLPRGNGETVLIIDDETSILTITSQTLQAFGYRVLTATDGAEAIAVYAGNQDKIAVVLTDMMMPVMDGPATIRALLRINPRVKIIAASGLKMEGATIRLPDANVKEYLMKPYTAGSLLKAIRTVLEEA